MIGGRDRSRRGRGLGWGGGLAWCPQVMCGRMHGSATDAAMDGDVCRSGRVRWGGQEGWRKVVALRRVVWCMVCVA